MNDKKNKVISLSVKKIVIISLICGSFVGVGFSAALAVKIFNSSDVEYCSSCHTLDPMVQAYRADIHGGKNRYPPNFLNILPGYNGEMFRLSYSPGWTFDTRRREIKDRSGGSLQ